MRDMATPGTAASRHRFWLVAILGLGALWRLAVWWLLRREPFVGSLVMDSAEYDRWAQRLAAGDWLGSEPFFQAPLYPYFIGAVYRLFGRSLDAIYLLQIAGAVAALWAIYRAGRELRDEATGLAAAALAAFYPVGLFHDVQLLKESLATSAVAFLLWGLVVAERGGVRRWLGLGALAGGLVLLRENTLLVLPWLVPFAWRGGASRRLAAARLGAAVGGLALVLAPVAARNAALGGGFLPTTSQGGVNFYIGNNPHADGTYRPLSPGRQEPTLERREPARLATAALGRPLSAAEVSRYWLRQALAWAAREPLAFARLQVRKVGLFWSWYEWPDAVDFYWLRARAWPLHWPGFDFGGAVLLAVAGLWLARRDLGRFAAPLLFAVGWMVSTVAFFLFARYRLPVVPALVLLAALPVVALGRAFAARRAGAALGWGALLAFAWLSPRLAGFAPRLDLVHGNLALLAEQAGDFETAERELRRAAAANPRDFAPPLGLGRLAARRADYGTARDWFARAAALEPGSVEAWTNLGSAQLAGGDLGSAATALDRALALDPTSLATLHDRALVAFHAGQPAAARDWNARALAVDPRHAPSLALAQRLAAIAR